MAERESLDYLEPELAKQIAGFDDSRQFYRRQQFRFTIGTAALSAATTVLIGVGQILASKWLSILSLVCSATVALAAAWDGFLRSRELWVQKTDTWMELQNLDANIKYAKARFGVLTQEQVDDFNRRFDRILMGEHQQWKKIRSTQGGSSSGKQRTKGA
jgi:hypothetical protein